MSSKTASELRYELDPLMREREVKAATKIGRTVRNKKIKAGLFPAPIHQKNALGLPGRTNYWLTSVIARYIAEEAAADRERTQQLAAQGLNGWLNRAVDQVQSKQRPAAVKSRTSSGAYCPTDSTKPAPTSSSQ